MAKVFQKDTNGTLLTSLVSYWKMEGNSNDFFGSNNGTDTSVTYSNANGKVNQGAGFNGTTSKIDVGVSTSLNLIGNFSYEFWFNGVTGTGERDFYGRQDNISVLPNMVLRVGLDTNNKLVFLLRVNGNSTVYTLTGTTIITAGWHHAIFIRNAASIFIYLDGVQDGTMVASAGDATDANNDSGTLGTGGGGFYTGNLDEIGIWSKALSAAEISDLYNGGLGQTMIIGGGTLNLTGVG